MSDDCDDALQRHFGDEWQQICQTLRSCQRIVDIMSNETTEDDVDRQQLRQIIRQIEPKKYGKSQRKPQRRSSYHRLKALTALLMTSDLKVSTNRGLSKPSQRSTSLQSVPTHTNADDFDDQTATLPRLRRRPKIDRFYHSLDVTDTTLDDSPVDVVESRPKADRSQLSLELSLETTTANTPTSQTPKDVQKQLNRHSCDASTLLSSSVTPQTKPVLKYSKKRLRGPYGEMLESRMTTRLADDERQSLTFIQELLRETEQQRRQLDSNARETTGAKTTHDDIQTSSDVSITAEIGRHLDARAHIVGELYDTEKSFVESLKDLRDRYARPLQEESIVDSASIERIFGRVPQLLSIHSTFLEVLRKRISVWNSRETQIGDLFHLFSDSRAFTTYSLFVDEWNERKVLIKNLQISNKSFAKFLSDKSREHRNKLSLDELLIGVIQRVPRLELLVKQLQKHTKEDHVDSKLLPEALTTIHALVLYINRVKETSLSSSVVSQQLDVSCLSSPLSECCDGLPASLSNSFPHLITSVTIRKRERVVLLFVESLVIVALKGRKKSEKFEENKYKVLNCFSLENLEINAKQEENQNSDRLIEVLEKDSKIIENIQINFISKLSHDSRAFLDSVLIELNQNISKRMHELNNQEKNLELILPEDSIVVTFSSQEKRQKFERLFKELKSERTRTDNSRLIPDFLFALPIRKTRAGLQFTCASPTIGLNDVWICNSDGFVGQISVLSLRESHEPTIVSSNGVCNSRIICMTCVPKSQVSSQSQSQSDSSREESPEESDSESDRRENERSCATMWFGTDDSSVHIYSCCDAIRIKKNKVKVALNARVEAITYFNEKVFVCLQNKSVALFTRLPNQLWNSLPEIREGVDCYRICVSRESQLWTCGHSSLQIQIRDSDLKPLFDSIDVSETTPDDFITHMTSVDDSSRVVVSTHNSLSIHIFSASEPFARLALVSIEPSVDRALVSCEDIIRQHKSACLRISCILGVMSHVWIGTSAGVIVVTDSESLRSEIVPNGHTGHVRFLTTTKGDGRPLVISGGDGIEVYRRASGQQLPVESGRDDSTNHVILFCCK